jgi:signal transduction histidine kinase
VAGTGELRSRELRPSSAAEKVLRTGRAAGVGEGGEASVASPVIVGGHLWGAIVASSRRGPLPSQTEERMAEFTELLATAIANADGRAQLKASRARIVAASDDTRRRLERDLHDGVQQRLVSLGLGLRATEKRVPPELPELRAALSQTAEGLNDAVGELQEISRGIHPAILSQGGLAPALRTLARRSAVPVDVTVETEERLPEPIEVAAYYVVAEALANVAKHAGASSASVEVEMTNAGLRLCVRDDGVGDADPARGSGLIGLADRVEALGGQIAVESPSGEGTSLEVTLPVAPAPR